jgi:hypothetical protein
MRNKGRGTAWLILMEAAILAGICGLLAIDRTEWIIRMGIRRADQLISLLWIAWAAAAAALNIAYLVFMIVRIRRANAAQVKLTFAQDKAQDPAEIRRELTRFMGERPRLKALLQQGLDQLDNIDRKKERMREILERNELSLLSQASDALDDAEQSLCRKLILILNRALLCDPEEENARRREAVFEQHARYMQTFLAENEDVLNRCEKLLEETVRYVEERKAGKDTMDLQIMTGVIRSLYDEGIRMETRQGGTRG